MAAAPTARGPEGEVVELSPFNVQAEKDEGYFAGNAIRRVYLNEPRRLRFTTTFDF